MSNESVCYNIGCGNVDGNSLKACSQCKWVRYCGVECQRNDWKKSKGNHKTTCAKYQTIRNSPNDDDHAHDPNELDATQLELALTEMKEGRFPLYYILDHPNTRRIIVAAAISILGYAYMEEQAPADGAEGGARQARRVLTMQIYNDELTEDQQKHIAKEMILRWAADLFESGQSDIADKADSKMPRDCHLCGKIDSNATPVGKPYHGDFISDNNVACTRLVCMDCLKEHMDMNNHEFEKPFVPKHLQWNMVAAASDTQKSLFGGR